MQNILITGGCGFIGSNLIRYLLCESEYTGAIVNVDKLTYAGNLENLGWITDRYADRYSFIEGDIGSRDVLAALFQEHAIDAVCHLAAESHVDRSIAEPDDFIRTNIIGTYNLLELARENKDRIIRFHHVSTDEVYGSLGANGYFREDTPYNPNSPYSASKAASDHLVAAYGKTYGLPVTISNCSNNYGPYQFPEKLIPLAIMSSREGRSIPLYGDGLHIRDWLYVGDHCTAIWLIMKKGSPGQIYNIGGNNEKPNIETLNLICELIDKKLPPLDNGPRNSLITRVKDRPGHDRRYAIDSSKLKDDLGWQPAETFESGIDKTIDWYLGNAEWTKRVMSGEYRTWFKKQYQL